MEPIEDEEKYSSNRYVIVFQWVGYSLWTLAGASWDFWTIMISLAHAARYELELGKKNPKVFQRCRVWEMFMFLKQSCLGSIYRLLQLHAMIIIEYYWLIYKSDQYCNHIDVQDCFLSCSKCVRFLNMYCLCFQRGNPSEVRDERYLITKS